MKANTAQLTNRGATKVRLFTDKKEHVAHIQRRYFSIFLRICCEGWTELSLFYTVGFQKSYWDKRIKSEASPAPVGNLRRKCFFKTTEREMFRFVTCACNRWISYQQNKLWTPLEILHLELLRMVLAEFCKCSCYYS